MALSNHIQSKCLHLGPSSIGSKAGNLGGNVIDDIAKQKLEFLPDGMLEEIEKYLTEFNTAHNRRITMLGISDGDGPGGGGPAKKRRKIRIQFNEEEDVINPEDVDPSIGR